ncbi:MAG TPA: hypothetical protein DEF41_05610 [Desulfovibrio sp.]|uniref:Uncharacterized protein n=1 Tax=Nitratidesulfovibrio vulgaris (strain ATCC 29579 / DSM 644 / CCUG 34227 / NCIMB 8303 / VKM B-1760 / Hildenborough) TaxID=882 RepID=Q728E3_NITV2|nr:hypothetical protein DVU_2660 [Nitratidesulfovibrio vulgaris str. Hildenborough]HBW15604.1 hypothetical protein [Desulfovibrio sp.]
MRLGASWGLKRESLHRSFCLTMQERQAFGVSSRCVGTRVSHRHVWLYKSFMAV